MSASLAIEIIEEWNYYDGFRDGVVRIKHPEALDADGDLYHAWAVDYRVEDDDATRIEARSLFHELHEALGNDLSGAMAEPPRLTFTYADLYKRRAELESETP